MLLSADRQVAMVPVDNACRASRVGALLILFCPEAEVQGLCVCSDVCEASVCVCACCARRLLDQCLPEVCHSAGV